MALTINDITTAAALLGGKGFFTPEILANKQYAAWFFGAQSPGQYMYAIPRYKYMYYANFVVNSQAAILYPWLRQLGSIEGVSLKIRAIDRPNILMTTQKLNQYNRNKIVYTKTDFRQFNMTIWDTVDNKAYDLWRQYYTYYFGDARQKSPATMASSPYDPTFTDSTGWGLRQLGEEVNFFSEIEVYAIFGKTYTRTTYLNPRIIEAQWGTFSQDEFSSLSDVKFTIEYETLRYDPTAPITPAIASQFGFDVGPPVPEPNMNTGAAIFRSFAGVTDSLLAQRNVTNNNPGSLIATGLSAIANFGMAAVSYSAYTGTGGGGLFTGQATPGAIKYATATGAFDNVYSTIPYGADYANQMVGAGGGLLGLPFGKLPYLTKNISQPFLTSFATVASPRSSSLSTFGSFNFGSGGLETPRY